MYFPPAWFDRRSRIPLDRGLSCSAWVWPTSSLPNRDRRTEARPQMICHALTQGRLLLRRPFAKPFAGFESEPAVFDQAIEIGRSRGRAIERGQHIIMDRPGKVGADEIGILQRAKHRQSVADKTWHVLLHLDGGFSDRGQQL